MADCMIAVEKGIPVPEPTGNGRPAKFPWRKLDVGDCFTVPVEPTYAATRKAKDTLDSCASRARKALNHRYVMRRVKEGIRVWRIA